MEWTYQPPLRELFSPFSVPPQGLHLAVCSAFLHYVEQAVYYISTIWKRTRQSKDPFSPCTGHPDTKHLLSTLPRLTLTVGLAPRLTIVSVFRLPAVWRPEVWGLQKSTCIRSQACWHLPSHPQWRPLPVTVSAPISFVLTPHLNYLLFLIHLRLVNILT